MLVCSDNFLFHSSMIFLLSVEEGAGLGSLLPFNESYNMLAIRGSGRKCLFKSQSRDF